MHTSMIRFGVFAALVLSTALTALLPQAAHAYDENSTRALNVDAQGVAVKGHDVVAYFTDGAPLSGKAEFSVPFDGATYLFASAAHRDAFKANPARFLPQFGGFCAMGVALEKKLDGDPSAWKIVDDRLYLNVSKGVQAKWLEDVPGNLGKANANWPRIQAKTPKALQAN